MIVVEIQCAIDAAGTLSTLYYSNDRFVTATTDTPASRAFLPNILDAGSLGIHAFADGYTGGSTKLEVGELTLANSDGSLDYLNAYSFDGRPIVIRSGLATAAYPGSWSTVFSGTVDSVEATWDKFIVRLRDKQFLFTLPVLTTRYAGTNSLPAGIEGTPTDIKGKVKPRVFGKVFSVTPSFVNTSKLVYQVSTAAVNSIDAVYDRGLALTPGANYANNAALLAAVTVAGQFDTCIAEGLIQLGSSPSGQITVDVTQGANAAARTVAQIIKTLALAAGVASGDVSAADVTAMDTANASVVGIYLDSETTYQDAIDQLLNSIGGYCGFDSAGVLRMGVLLTPTGTPVVSLYEYNIFEGIEKRAPKNNGIPSYRVTLNHTKVYTVQNSDLAGAVTTPTRAYLEKEYRSTVSEDTAIKTQFLLAGEYSVDTLLTVAADASTEAARQLALYKVRRDLVDVPTDASLFITNSLKLGDVVQLVVPRFGWTAGKLMRLIGYNLSLTDNKVILQLWG